jgi:hypothetical protein
MVTANGISPRRNIRIAAVDDEPVFLHILERLCKSNSLSDLPISVSKFNINGDGKTMEEIAGIHLLSSQFV